MKVKIYVQEEDLMTLHEFFKNENNIDTKKIRKVEYWTDYEEFADLEYIGKLVEVVLDFEEYMKLEYLQ